ncbi:MAG: glycosyltransferase [Lutibacter sp.]|nr:glycosyltransferase [Lutibacter sp.]
MIVIANTLVPNGGTTFLIRMAKEYNHKNEKISVIILYDNYSKEHLDDLRKYADVFFIKEFSSGIFSFFSKSQIFPFIVNLKNYKLKRLLENENTIHVMGIFGFVLAKRLQKILPKVKITVGVYHQNEFMYQSVNCYFNRWVFKEIAKLNYNYFIFFNNGTRTTYSKYFNLKFNNSPILPIGISFKKSIAKVNDYTKGLIISVGNLAAFKSYNKHIINCLPAILKKNSQAKYHIYGIGEELDNLQYLVNNLNLNDSVVFKGLLDYNNFDEVVSKAHVFIGNGTAVLESANVGVPSITGIESCELPVSYGFVSDIEGFDYNEYIFNKKSYKFEWLLNNLFQGGDFERERMGALCKSGVKKFDISNTIKGFDEINAIENKVEVNLLTSFELVKLFLSFIFIGVVHVLKIDNRFKFRRNQG